MEIVYEDETFRVLTDGYFFYPQNKGTGILTEWGFIYDVGYINSTGERMRTSTLALAMEFKEEPYVYL